MAFSIVSENSSRSDDWESSKISKQSSFYSPLCLTGYLTPLQRKKMREKRNLDIIDDKDDGPKPFKKIKKSYVNTKNKIAGICYKNKCKISSKAVRKSVPNKQYSVNKISRKVTDNYSKDKRFFKTDACYRLQRTTFMYTLVSTKNKLFDYDRNNKRKIQKECKTNQYTDQENYFEEDEVLKPQTTNISFNYESVCPSQYFVLKDHNTDFNNSMQRTSSKQYIFDFNWPPDDVLLERQTKARNVCREKCLLNDPDKKNENEKKLNDIDNVRKLFPVFNVVDMHNITTQRHKTNQEIKQNFKCVKSVKNPKGGEQMVIDAGQKELDAKMCNTCSMIYTVGQDDDEKLHSSYHSMYLSLRFPGWKDENVIGEYHDGRIIMVRKDEKFFKLKRIKDVLAIANRDLGFPNTGIPFKPDLTFLLFISLDKRVVGCTVAEPISSACKLILADCIPQSDDVQTSDRNVYRIGNWCSSFEKVPAVCGVNRIWVSHNFRRHKVASRMLDCLRCHFLYGHVIGTHELAFTDPTPDGREFAAFYTGTDYFLVYR